MPGTLPTVGNYSLPYPLFRLHANQASLPKTEYDNHLPRLSFTIGSVVFGPCNSKFERIDDLYNWHVRVDDGSKKGMGV